MRALLPVTVLLAGCAVGPDYRTPPMELPGEFLNASAVSSLPAPESSGTWWQRFGDEKLNTLIARAAEHNHDIDIALARVNEARALAREAFAELLPGVAASTAYQSSRTSGARFPGPAQPGFRYELWSAGLDALWEIDLFGRLRRGKEARDAQLEAAGAELSDVLRLVFADVGAAYLQLRGAQAQLATARRNIENQERVVELARVKFEAGMTTELDVARARAQLMATRATVPELEAAARTAIHRLTVLVGASRDDLDLSTPVPLPHYRGASNLDRPVDLLRRRPDLRAAERQLAAATADIGVAVGELYPKVTFEGSIAVEAIAPDRWTAGGAGTYNVLPRISWTPFDTGRLRSRIRASEARRDGALSNYERSVLRALEETENALVSFAAQRSKRDALIGAVRESTRAHELAEIQYRTGVTDFLTVLEAQATLLENEAALTRTETEVALSLVSLYKALGGGWEEYRAG